MAQLLPQPHHSLDRWLHRLDRAAGSMNPILTLLAIGLTVLNLACLALLAPRLPITRDTQGLGACLLSSESAPATARPPTGDIKAWGY